MKKQLLNILQKILAGLARMSLKKSDVDIIGITGSYGKSSTREAVFQVLKLKYKNQVKESSGNLNNEIGLPLVVLGYNKNIRWWYWPWVILMSLIKVSFSHPLKNTKVLVLEYAADKPGDIKYLTSIAKPKIAVITKIGFAHTQNFGSLDNVAKEKTKLVEVLMENNYAILNQDDPFSEKIKNSTKAKVISFNDKGLDTSKEIAKLIGRLYGVDVKKSEEVLNTIKPLKGRLNIISGEKESRVIDDTYNSNPSSCILALDFLSRQSGRKIAVLGDMLELGLVEIEGHKKISNKAKEVSDLFIAVGQRFKDTGSDYWFSDPVKAGNFILSKIKKGDIILVKGSQAMRLEKVVEIIMREKSIMSELLVRQEPAWKKKQFKQE